MVHLPVQVFRTSTACVISWYSRWWRLSCGFLRGLECLSRRCPLLWHLKHKPNFSYNWLPSFTYSWFFQVSYNISTCFSQKHYIKWVLACCFSWAISICLNLTLVSLVQDSLYYWSNQRLSLDLTLGFSHSSRSLRSTYLGCSFNFCLLHLTTIFGGSFVTICCILVAGLKPAPWMFSQYMLRELSNCFHPDLLISPGTYWSVTLKLELGFQIVQSAFHTIAQRLIFWTFRG